MSPRRPASTRGGREGPGAAHRPSAPRAAAGTRRCGAARLAIRPATGRRRLLVPGWSRRPGRRRSFGSAAIAIPAGQAGRRQPRPEPREQTSRTEPLRGVASPIWLRAPRGRCAGPRSARRRGIASGRPPVHRPSHSAGPGPSASTSGRSSPGRAGRAATSREGGTGSSSITWRTVSIGVSPLKRRPSRQHLVKDRAQGVNVGRRPDAPREAPRLLGAM